VKLLKIDSVHPFTCLDEKQAMERARLEGMSYEQYYDWLMGQRMGLSDFLTKPMRDEGWDARQFLPRDRVLQKKIEGQKTAGVRAARKLQFFLRSALDTRPRDIFDPRWPRRRKVARRLWTLDRYIRDFRPDAIAVREPTHMDEEFFDRFRGKCLMVAFIGCNTNHVDHWDPHRFDVIFTLTEDYRRFFEVQGIESHIFHYGVDERIAGEAASAQKEYDCSFVGFLGAHHQSRKTDLLERVAAQTDFHWWGDWEGDWSRYPALKRAWRGVVSGIDMLKVYGRSKIVLNDYPDFMQNQSNNMRNMEVMEVGSFLLTRAAESLGRLEREGALVTFTDVPDCLEKIRHYLANDEERERIARKGLEVVTRDYNYKRIGRDIMHVISAAHERKRPSLKAWGA
jgi:hypothetical protein